MFVGRRKELVLLEDAYRSPKSELVVIYGRRRIGKSSLVNHFGRGKSYFFPFEAVEGETTQLFDHFPKLLFVFFRAAFKNTPQSTINFPCKMRQQIGF